MRDPHYCNTIYLIGLIVYPLILGLLNLKFNFVNKRSLDKDLGFVSVLLVVSTIMWPLVVGFLITIGLLWVFYKLFVRK